ncbi:hypothetical protein BAE44_0015065 [Dichanthelium oligosanthes]|uniref:Agenet domain-containing protein n=1 Tax=Dichanthelium oligosanthes TaxID=888268 RepID=A0A1E5VFK4_9POAL|nr:hypothetical protein BAE44_0015065 [Dichanthelium oligosanthes]
MDLLLPFKIGDLAESKSLLTGYRGAWFRCKVRAFFLAFLTFVQLLYLVCKSVFQIHNMGVHKSVGYLQYYLEYIDYPGERIALVISYKHLIFYSPSHFIAEKEWIRVFQKNPTSSNQNSRESTQLMIRPSFPQWYFGHEIPEQFPNSDVTAIVDETWKVGDLVDWLTEGCYWSGTITKLLNDDMVEVELPAPPIGEGKCYTANRNELRPTLDWSLTKESETSDDDEYGDNEGGVQRSVLASNMPQKSPGPVVLASPKDQMDNILPSKENLKPSSTSKPADPGHGTQSAATSSQPVGTGVTIKQEPGIGVSIKQEQDLSLTEAEAAADGPDEFLEKLDALQAELNYTKERTRVEHDRCTAVLAFCRGSSKDDASDGTVVLNVVSCFYELCLYFVVAGNVNPDYSCC